MRYDVAANFSVQFLNPDDASGNGLRILRGRVEGSLDALSEGDAPDQVRRAVDRQFPCRWKLLVGRVRAEPSIAEAAAAEEPQKAQSLLPTIETADGTEVVVEWTCPDCQRLQQDSVHPTLGPFVSCTCGDCGKVFSDGQLSEEDAERWESARAQAEEMRTNEEEAS